MLTKKKKKTTRCTAPPDSPTHLVLTFGIFSPCVFIFFPFCPQQKITLVLALSIRKISTVGTIVQLKCRMHSARKAVQDKVEEIPPKPGI